jgi:cardiolipin synthase
LSTLNLILAAFYYVVAALTVIHVVMDNRQPAKTMAWALVIWFVPVAGIILYFFFGVNTRKERLVSQRSLDELSKRTMGHTQPLQAEHIGIYTDGYQFFPALLADIAAARDHIHVNMYIFEDDPLGNLVADALKDKARQGVKVRVIFDDVGCWRVPHQFFEQMREEGIEVVPFLPVRFPSFTSKVNYRNHRKMVVIDGRVGYIGGMNIARRYVKGTKTQSWRDTMIRVTGTAVYSLQRAFLIDWYFVDRTLVNERRYYPQLPSPDLQPSTVTQTVTSGPDSPQPEIMQEFVRIIVGAKHYVYIETPYFLPAEPVLFALKMAAAAGVDVRILVPSESDAWFAEWAGRSYLREMLKAGVSIRLYTAGFLHSKLLVCDDGVCTCGSTNVDFRSFENNFEANAFFYGQQTACRMKQLFLSDEAQSVALAALPQRVHPRFMVRLTESLLRMLAPLM